MRESTDGSATVATKKRRVLRYGSFAEGVLEKIAEEAKCSKAIVFKAVKLAYALLRHYDLIDNIDHGELIERFDGWGKILVINICQKLKDNIPEEFVLQVAVAEVLDDIYKTHVHRNLYDEAINRLNGVYLDLERSGEKIDEIKRENSELRRNLEVTQNRAEQAERLIKGLKGLISVMTYTQTREREALLKEFIGGQVGQIVDPSVFSKNP
ncbi:MAG: hypothetical protein WC242_04065 [Candidatus Paceibacterota bacterium]|jgi:hypothetical protein